MRNAQEDFCAGVMAGYALAFLSARLAASAPVGATPKMVYEQLLLAMDHPDFRPSVIAGLDERLAKDAWTAWRKAEVAQGRPLVVVTGAPQSGEDGTP